MSTNSQEQEIDLAQIGTKIKNIFQGVLNSFFDFIFFLKKKIILVSFLLILGLTLGYFLDKNGSYSQDIIVIPNFGSNEYLYKKVAFLNSRIKDNDEDFFKSIGVENFDVIKKIEIKAVNGVFKFVNQGGDINQNLELIKLMAEEGSIDEIIKSDIASKNYYTHNITITTTSKVNQKNIIDPILKYLQESEFYKIQQKIYQENTNNKIKFNDSLIAQIDNLILKLSSNGMSSTISISENKGISELINKKDELIKESQNLKINQHEYEEVIKVQSISLNNLNTKGLNHKMKIFLPLLLIVFYLIFYNFIILYKKQITRVQA